MFSPCAHFDIFGVVIAAAAAEQIAFNNGDKKT